MKIAIEKLHLRPLAFRQIDRRDPDYQTLRDSIRDWGGVLVPLTVRPRSDGDYEVLSGANRYDICRCLRFKEVDCKVVQCGDEEADRIELEANATRIDPKPIEYTRRLLRLVQQRPEMSLAELCRLVHRSPSWVQARLDLFNRLKGDILDLVLEGKIGIQNALNLAKVSPTYQDRFVDLARTLSVADFGELVTGYVQECYDSRVPEPAQQLRAIEPRIRRFREIKEVYDRPEKLVSLIAEYSDKKCIVRAILEWILQMDAPTLARRNALLLKMKNTKFRDSRNWRD